MDRLESHPYSSSDREHISRVYAVQPDHRRRGARWADPDWCPGRGAADEQITYWSELTAILDYARRDIRSTLGLCWGGMALARQLGIDKQLFPQKLFGVFENRTLVPTEPLLGGGAGASAAPRAVILASATT